MKYNCNPDYLEREIIKQIKKQVLLNCDEVEQLTNEIHELYNVEEIKIQSYVHPADYCGEARLEFLQMYAEAEMLREELAMQIGYLPSLVKPSL